LVIYEVSCKFDQTSDLWTCTLSWNRESTKVAPPTAWD